ncbi:Unknown protein [Striga hermonthica]|uniref:Uncharacterized protein n=1 Tax=Striga hermonthica TaxID=68872 RepID=A0A9N7NV25_STRHE|nr:Unknown protein [Striga hermonthica]
MASPDETSALEIIRQHLLDDHIFADNYFSAPPQISRTTSDSSSLTSEITPIDPNNPVYFTFAPINYGNSNPAPCIEFSSTLLTTKIETDTFLEFRPDPLPADRRPSLSVAIPPAAAARHYRGEYVNKSLVNTF